MDVIELAVVVRPGKPAAVGHLGTVVVSPPDGDGEMLVRFVLSRKMAKKMLRKQKVDKRSLKIHTERPNTSG